MAPESISAHSDWIDGSVKFTPQFQAWSCFMSGIVPDNFSMWFEGHKEIHAL